MKTLVISEDQMTFVLKQFLRQYQGQFDHVSFDDTGQGYVVHFHQSQEPALIPANLQERNDDDRPDLPTALPPFSIPFPDFTGPDASPGGDIPFGGFGGGSSGGAGASGDW